jgi:intraflagellar transport protein 56
MNMFKAKGAKKVPVKGKSGSAVGLDKDKKPKLEEFISARDYTGAITLLEFQRHTGEANALTLPWLGFAAFHLGDYKKALDVYTELAPTDPVYNLYASCCQFYLGEYAAAEELARKGVPGNSGGLIAPTTANARLQNRLLFHISHKQNDEAKLMKHHALITDATEDQLSLASIHYLRNHFQEATDIYKRLLIEYRDYLALQVYVSSCYYKLDYYDVSLEILAPYLSAHPDSAIAINLKACNHYKLYDGKAAEAELKGMLESLHAQSHNFDNDLVRHNLVVFRGGANALQVLPPLVGVVPEARLNFVIYHLRHHEIMEAYELIKDLEPTTPQEYILKGVVNASVGQLNDSREHLKLAQQFFQLVGASASECDTIPGRQVSALGVTGSCSLYPKCGVGSCSFECSAGLFSVSLCCVVLQCMASCFFLLKQFDDVLIYLNSVKAYSYADSIFNFNHGIALAATEQYRDAEEALLLVSDEKYRSEYIYLSWLARCFIMNGKARDAWELYLKMESNTDSFAMLVLIANDCYKVGAFYYAAKAFDVLERLDPSNEYWEGKRGACCGVFQQVVARVERKEHLRDVIQMLRNNVNSPQSEFMVRVMRKWCDSGDMAAGGGGGDAGRYGGM